MVLVEKTNTIMTKKKNNHITLKRHIRALKYRKMAEVGNSFSDASRISEASFKPA